MIPHALRTVRFKMRAVSTLSPKNLSSYIKAAFDISPGLSNNRIRSWLVPRTIYPYSLAFICAIIELNGFKIILFLLFSVLYFGN